MTERPPEGDRHFHVPPDEYASAESGLHALPELAQAHVVSLIDPRVEDSAELLFGQVRLAVDTAIPWHSHDHAETMYLLEGAVRVQLGRGSAEIWGSGAAYFPPKIPHSIETVGEGDAIFLICYARGDISRNVETVMVDSGADLSDWPNPNVITEDAPLYRWALVDDFESPVPVEPTKGWDLTARYLFDPERGAPDLVVGIGAQKPNVHYTIHKHEPAELFYVKSGRGTIYVGQQSFEVRPGSSVYVPSGVPHGIDTFDSPMNVCWVYGLDRCGSDWTWEAVEPIYNRPTRR
jgi:quercetin dioxygenase-like cupin family protein